MFSLFFSSSFSFFFSFFNICEPHSEKSAGRGALRGAELVRDRARLFLSVRLLRHFFVQNRIYFFLRARPCAHHVLSQVYYFKYSIIIGNLSHRHAEIDLLTKVSIRAQNHCEGRLNQARKAFGNPCAATDQPDLCTAFRGSTQATASLQEPMLRFFWTDGSRCCHTTFGASHDD